MRLKKSLFLLLPSFLILTGVLFISGYAQPPKQAMWEDVQGEARIGGYRLITTEILWEKHQENPAGIFLVDTRRPWEYRSGHIKGAFNFPMEPTWLARIQRRGALKDFLGPDKNRFIVFY